jgi:hypothetical protein
MIDISFQWTRSLGYECVGTGNMRRIQPTGKKRDEPFEPLRIQTEKPLYLRFAELDGSEEACLRFAQAWGLLLSEKQTEGERLSDWRDSIREMKNAVSALGALDEQPGGIVRRAKPGAMAKITTLDVLLRSGDQGSRPALVLKPRHLQDAMYLQLGKFVAGDGSVGVCKQCNGWFERGAGDSRRSIAIFCSEKCKNRFHYLERNKR